MKKLGLITLFLWCSFPAYAENTVKPQELEFYIGDLTSVSKSVKIQNGATTYTFTADARPFLNSETIFDRRTIKVSDEKWAEFRKTLDKLNIWDWANEYKSPDFVDGIWHYESWSIKIKYNDKSISSYSSGKDADSKNLQDLRQAISDLTGEKW